MIPISSRNGREELDESEVTEVALILFGYLLVFSLTLFFLGKIKDNLARAISSFVVSGSFLGIPWILITGFSHAMTANKTIIWYLSAIITFLVILGVTAFYGFGIYKKKKKMLQRSRKS